jgi:hypothetical protein
VAVVKRHLTLNELREAISTEIGQPYSKPEKLVNGIEHIVTWCENLLHVDEELNTVYFAHRSIYAFIIGRCSEPRFSDFHIDIEGADHHAGEVCVTYLDFNDFKTTLARRPQPIRSPRPTEIVQTALGHHGSVAQSALRFMRSISEHRKSDAKLDIIGNLASYERIGAKETFGKLQQGHPFLQYAAKYWISHTRKFRDGESTTWGLWRHFILHGHPLAQTPWLEHDFNSSQSGILRWSFKSHHYALVRLVDSCGAFHESERSQMMAQSAVDGDVGLISMLLDGKNSTHSINTSLQAGSEGGHLEVIEQLLAAGADVNVEPAFRGRTALQTASEGGYIDVVERLLAAGANINGEPATFGGRTALQAASQGGHLEVVERLLAAGANVNAKPTFGGRTALQAASEGGHLEVVERLLAGGADINAKPASEGRTALQAASEGGHLEVVERLLAAGAEINAKAAAERG